MQDPLEAYVAELIREKGEQESEELKAKLLAEVNDLIDEALIGELSPEQLKKLEQAAQEDDVSENLLRQLLAESNIDPSDVMADVLVEFKTNYLKG